ncbi:MAG: uncharacterized protein KVP18_003447 [Porospora cf. gigantea A]|uniref:uncharacterized protein n=1 Tax=Porospora cf. gigantea A TaxID=2853593 RepID=UPI003559CE5B|nr:MAG: hypothetical protein KVP18_003447 [Porospora cf. gigantea A]
MCDSDSTAKALEEFEKLVKKPFLGLVKVAITDSDRLPRQTKGNSWMGCVHETMDEEGTRTWTTFLPTDDPLDYLRVSGQKEDYLSISWFAGCMPDNFKLGINQLVARLKGVTAKDVQEGGSLFRGVAHLPGLTETYSRPVVVEVHSVEYKLQTRVSKIVMTLSADNYCEWLKYWQAFNKWGKPEEDKKDKADSKDNVGVDAA